MMASERKANLLADLRATMNNPGNNPGLDVCIKCVDKTLICSSGMLPMIRCAKLKSRLNCSGWAQTKTIDLSDCGITSSALLPILELLHTGDIVQYLPFSSTKAEEIIQASKELQLPEVEKIVTKFHERVEGVEGVALKLSVALEKSGTHAGDSNQALVKILSAANLNSVHLRNLSEKAFTHYLKQTDSESRSFTEYIRFRQVILWCVTQICPDEAADVVAKALLEVKSCQASETDHRKGFLNSLLTKRQESKALMERLLQLVHYERIPFNYLEHVVEPLDVVPSKRLLRAFTSSNRLDTWEHGSSYRVKNNKSAIEKCKADPGFAIFSTPIDRDHDVYEWIFFVDEFCDNFCEIGIFNVDGLQKVEFTSTLSEQPTGRVIRHEYLQSGLSSTRINKQDGHDTDNGWKNFEQKLEAEKGKKPRVKVKLDMDQRVCSLATNGGEYLEAWRDLPSSTYYPAVSLGNDPKGKVHIELRTGFPLFPSSGITEQN